MNRGHRDTQVHFPVNRETGKVPFRHLPHWRSQRAFPSEGCSFVDVELTLSWHSPTLKTPPSLRQGLVRDTDLLGLEIGSVIDTSNDSSAPRPPRQMLECIDGKGHADPASDI